jgi:hypothetical protein
MLYLTPGLLAVQVAHIVYLILGIRTIRRFLLPELYTPRVPNVKYMPPARFTIFLALLICSTAILTPLDIIATRLTIQRNHATSGLNTFVQAEGDSEESKRYVGLGEDVIGFVKAYILFFNRNSILMVLVFRFRSEDDPYLGLADCAKRIVDEEGYRVSLAQAIPLHVVDVTQALYRTWWLTMLGSLGGALS